MTYYYPTKNAALDAGTIYEGHWYVSAELCSYNGWVLVLRPRTLEVLNWPLAPLMEVAEIEFTKRLRKRPAEYRPAPPVAKVRPRPIADSPGHGGKARPAGEGAKGGGAAPVRGATAKVWEIADGVGKADRNAIIQACVAQGINPSTAATQYSKWKKARGL